MHPFEDLAVPQGALGIHWFGQSSYGLKNEAGTIVQVDPYFPHDRPADRFIHGRPPLLEASLRTDAVLLTHDHGDHTCMESLERIAEAYPECRFVGPPESGARLRDGGIAADRIVEITAGEQATAGTMTAHAVWSKPPEGDPERGIDGPGVQHLGFVVDTGPVRIYISGDNINSFADLPAMMDPVRALSPQVGCLTNHPDEGEFPYFADCGRIATGLGLRAAIPSHYQCFVTRDYDPHEWATHIAPPVRPLIIAYNQSVVYRGA